MAKARDVMQYPAVRRYLLSTALSATATNLLVTVLLRSPVVV